MITARYQLQSRTAGFLAATIIGATLPAPREAQARRSAVAVILVGRDGPDAKLLAAVREAIDRFDSEAGSVQLLVNGALRRHLRRRPAALVEICGTDARCMARIARKANAAALLYLRIIPSRTTAGRSVLQFLVVGTRSRSIEAKGSLDLLDPHETCRQVFAELQRALPSVPARQESLQPIAALRTDAPASVVEEDPAGLSLAPIAPVPQAQTPEPEHVTTEPQDPVVEPTAAPEPPASSQEPQRSSEPSLADPPQPEPTVLELPAVTEKMESSSTISALGYSGCALALAGLGATAAGAYYGWRSRMVVAAFERDPLPPQLTQTEAKSRLDRSHKYSDTANILFGAGGVAAVLGMVLVVNDLVSENDNAVELDTGVSPGHAQVEVTFSW